MHDFPVMAWMDPTARADVKATSRQLQMKAEFSLLGAENMGVTC